MENNQLQPTTGEWTADTVESIAIPAFIECRDGYEEVADAHNAALRNAQPFLDDALKQLAAGEREKVGRLQRELEATWAKWEADKEQLATAVEALKECVVELEDVSGVIQVDQKIIKRAKAALLAEYDKK